MKTLILVLVVLAALVALPTVADSSADAQPSETLVFVGEYKWTNRDKSGPLRAEFTATGENTWNVDFHFRFDGRDRTYTGTAEGSLSQGELRGNVYNENKRRTFTFEGDFDDGRFQGTHEETTRSRARRTGTLALSAES